MSRVDFLTESRNNFSVKFLEFTRIASSGEKACAVFFEGEDAKYYSVRISSTYPGLEWNSINCGGKKMVLSLRNTIRSHENYKNSSCLFFVDADFDDNSALLTYSDVYVTPCYSIENLYCSDQVIKNILNAEFKLTEFCESGACYTQVLQNFRSRLSEYLSCITPFNAWLKAYRNAEKQGLTTGKLNINNLKFSSLIKVDLQSCEIQYNKDNVISLFPDADQTVEIIIPEAASVNNAHKAQWFRGKQHLEFMRAYVEALQHDYRKKSNRLLFKKNGKSTLVMSSNILSELSNYAETPKCLHNFLRSNLANLQCQY